MADETVPERDLSRPDEGETPLSDRLSGADGAPALDAELAPDPPAALFASIGHDAVVPAGNRAVRRPAGTAGLPPQDRHNWVPIGPRNVAGRMRAIAASRPGDPAPQVWFAGSAGGGVYRSTDAGLRWEALPAWQSLPSLTIGALAVSPKDERWVYAATGEGVPATRITMRGHGVYVSEDGGDTWTNHGGGAQNPVHRGGFEALALHPDDPRHAWAVGVDGAFRTLDGGRTWQHFAVGTHVSDAAFSGTGAAARLLLVRLTSTAGRGSVLRLDTPGASVADVTTALASAAAESVVLVRTANAAWPSGGKVAVASSTIAYARFVDEDDRDAGLFRTNNLNAATGSAVTWVRLREGSEWAEETQGTYDLVLAVDPARPGTVVTGMQFLWAATNADGAPSAVSWHKLSNWALHDDGLRGHHADMHQAVIVGTPPQLWLANDGGIARTLDLAATQDADWVRPTSRGVARWERRDEGISGAQAYDLSCSPLVPFTAAVGLQDNGTYVRTGGQTWRPVFGGDGAFTAFDPDDPYRLHLTFYGGMFAIQYPALLDAAFPDEASGRPEHVQRALSDGLEDASPFVPPTARHPRDTGSALLARNGRLYRLRTDSGERFQVEPVGHSFCIRLPIPAPLDPPPSMPDPLPPPVPSPPDPRIDVEVADTPGAHRLGLVPGRAYVLQGAKGDVAARIVLPSRRPGPYRLTEGDRVTISVNGVGHPTVFRAADGLDLSSVTVGQVVATFTRSLPPDVATAVPSLWATPHAVQVVTTGTGAAQTITLGGDALDPLPDGLSRLGLNRGTYRGGAGRPASLLLGAAGLTDAARLVNRDFSGPVRTLDVSINGGSVRHVRIEPPSFPDPSRVTAGQLAGALGAALAADPVEVHAVPHSATLVLEADSGFRVVLSGTLAARLAVPPAGAPRLRLGVPGLRELAHQPSRNFGSVDLSSGGPPLELVVSDGVTSTPPLAVDATMVADLRSVTVEELHTLMAAHLAASAGVHVRVGLLVAPAEGIATEPTFSEHGKDVAWAGGQDGSVFVTRDGGAAWAEVSSSAMRLGTREVGAIWLHPGSADTALVGLAGESAVPGDSGFCFRTRDGGRTWQQVGHTTVAGRAEGIAVNGRALGVNALAADPADPSTVFAATDAGVFRTRDLGTTWAPVNEGLPNAPVIDLAVEPTNRVLRAALWTRGVFERRLDDSPPDDVRLLVRTAESDDGRRPARRSPSYGTAAAGVTPSGSPDIKVVRSRPPELGLDAAADPHVDGVRFDLAAPGDDVVADTAASVLVQVQNVGATPVPTTPGAPDTERAKVVVLWAPADAGPPPLPGELWTALAAGAVPAGPLPVVGPAGSASWTVLGDVVVGRTIGAGDNGVVSVPVTWPALAGVRTVGLLALARARDDALTGRVSDVELLVATERRAAYREVGVRLRDEDRTLVLHTVDGSAFLIGTPPAGTATSVAAQLGFAPAQIGVAAQVLTAATAPGEERALPAANPGPALLLRRSVPLTATVTLDPRTDEARDRTAVRPAEVAAVLRRLLAAADLPISARARNAGFRIQALGGLRVRCSGGAAARLGLPGGGNGLAEHFSQLEHYNLSGAASLRLTLVRGPGAGVEVAHVDVDLSQARMAGFTGVDADMVVRAVATDVATAGLAALIVCTPFQVAFLSAPAPGMTLTGPGLAALGVSTPVAGQRTVRLDRAPVDLSATPALTVSVQPEVLVRFDSDPSPVVDVAHARHADIRRAISAACRFAGIPVRADPAYVDLRVAASTSDPGSTHAVLGGAALAELASGAPGMPAPDRDALFSVRTALGDDRLTIGSPNSLYLRVRNTGTVASTSTRLRLFEVTPAAVPVAVTAAASATPTVPAGQAVVEELSWDPGGAPRTACLLAVADDDRPGTRVDVPATLPDLAALLRLASIPGAALRMITVESP